jgi:hypothetical protein
MEAHRREPRRLRILGSMPPAATTRIARTSNASTMKQVLSVKDCYTPGLLVAGLPRGLELVERALVDSDVEAQAAALYYMEDGWLARMYEANEDPGDYRWIVECFRAPAQHAGRHVQGTCLQPNEANQRQSLMIAYEQSAAAGGAPHFVGALAIGGLSVTATLDTHGIRRWMAEVRALPNPEGHGIGTRLDTDRQPAQDRRRRRS